MALIETSQSRTCDAQAAYAQFGNNLIISQSIFSARQPLLIKRRRPIPVSSPDLSFLVKRRATRDTALASALAVVICFSKMQLQVGKIYCVKAADTLKIQKPAARGDWSQIDPEYLKPGDIVYVEEIRRTTVGSVYWVRVGNASGVLHFDSGVNMSEFLELVG